MHRRWKARKRRRPRIFVHPLSEDQANSEAEAVVADASSGDPGALRQILAALSAYLVGQSRLPREYALFCSEALHRFVGSETMEGAGAAFRDYRNAAFEKASAKQKAREAIGDDSTDFFGDLQVMVMLGRGPRLPSKWLRRIGASFSRAFQLRGGARRTIAPASVRIGTEAPSLAHPMAQDFAHVDAMKEVERARKGEVGTLRPILHSLAKHLKGEEILLLEYAFFCSDALADLVESDEMEEAEVAFRRVGRLEIEGSSNEWGDRVPGIRTIERAFCRHFHISKPPGMNTPNHPSLCPSAAWKVMQLRYFGETLDRSIEIVCSYYSNTTPRYVKTWVRNMGFDEPIPGTLGGNELADRRLHLGARVLREVCHGASLPQAFGSVGRQTAIEVIDPLASAEDAENFEDLIPLRSETVEQAYSFALKCRSDPRWDRLWSYMERRFRRHQVTEAQPA